ncbi:protein O-GlcNAc transferase [Azospirillaceae bacterium]
MISQEQDVPPEAVKEPDVSLLELLGTAERLSAAGAADALRALYDTWITRHADHPLAHVACFNYGVVLSGLNDLQGARTALEAAIRHAPDFPPPYINLGLIYERLGLGQQALEVWTNVVNRLGTVSADAVSYKATTLKQMGRLYESLTEIARAEEVLRQCIELQGNQPEVIRFWLMLRQRQCKWPVVTNLQGVESDAVVRNMAPLSLASYCDDPLLHLANAAHHNRHDVGWPRDRYTAGPWPPPEPRPETCAKQRLRIGYLSSDLREHSIGLLMAEVFELHDREAVEVLAYYCGPHLPDGMQDRIKGSVDRWVELGDQPDKLAARLILDHGVDILVDINGYTRFARTQMLALRPAPVIVNWLGYPGTMGSPYHDYIIADDYIIPPEYELFYSERVLRLPCYQPNDRKRVIAPTPLNRAGVGLPDQAVVYASFNGPHKITPAMFALWTEILAQVPNGVLWLLADVPEIDARLRELARAAGIDPARLIFAPRMKNVDHLNRYRLADVILDTWPYGAHTTASDALWMGVPIITLSGRSFASRVCGSLAISAGIPELVCTTPQEYVARATELGRNPRSLQICKDFLQLSRDTNTLFDTPDLVKNLENLYREMWAAYRNGTTPRPDLRNLEVYHEVGLELLPHTTGFLSDAEYGALYAARLDGRDAFSPIPDDDRFRPAAEWR